MYKPQDMERPQYPMFKKVNGRIISFLSLKAALAIGVAVVFAIILALVLGIPTKDVSVATTDTDKLSAKTLLQAQRAAAALPEVEAEMAPLQNEAGTGPKTGLTSEQTVTYNELSQEKLKCKSTLTSYTSKTTSELTSLAKENGITRHTTDEEIEARVPNEKIESQQVVSVPARWAVALAIVGLAFMLFSEFGERSLAEKLMLTRKYATSQHVYKYKRHTGSHYDRQEALRS